MDREGKQLEEVERELGNLPKVEAPVNFEQMVRTQIAAGRPADSMGRAQLLLALKFALPTLLLMVFGAILIFSGMKEPNDQAIAPIDEHQLRPDSPLTSEISVNNETVAASTNGNLRTSNINARANSANAPVEPSVGIQSVDLGVQPAPTPIYPEGLDRNMKKMPPPNAAPGKIDPAAILSILGLQLSCSPQGCNVTQAAEAGVGAKAGIKAGDVIEQLNGKNLNDPEAFAGRLILKSLTVRRGGKVLQINLQN